MDYPIKLLPKPNYKSIETGLEEKCILRHFVSNPALGIVDDLGYLKDYVIASGGDKQLPDLSTSLYGIFTLEDIILNITNDSLNDYCVPNFDSTLPVYDQDFNISVNRSFWSIMIENIHNQKVDYDGDDFKATCYVKHTPTKSNFWHFSITWFINSENKFWNANDGAISASVKKKLKKETRDFIKLFAKQEILSDSIIEEEHYCN